MHNPTLFPIVLSASTFLSYSALAACTTNPDCAALGYTKTSCRSGDITVRCFFDTAKVACIPGSCESIGKKTCGDMCIKSSDCCTNTDCASGKVCNNYVCKEAVCAVGDIFYSDKTCSANLISGKTPIGVVGYVSNGGKNGVVAEKNHSSSTMPWGCYDTDLSCITDMPGSDGGSNPELRADYNGKSNTACMVSNRCVSGTYCNSKNVEGVTGWYLPAGGELYDTMIGNRSTVNTGLSKISGSTAIDQSHYYWSSSEYSGNPASRIWYWDVSLDGWYLGNKFGNAYVRCVLAF